MDPRAVLVDAAGFEARAGRYAVVVNGRPLLTPAGNPVETESRSMAENLVEELEADGFADVTAPGLYAFFSTQRDFIEPAPDRTVDALADLLSHDYLLHPDERLGVRQVQIAAWRPQVDLWERVAGREPPYAPPFGEPEIPRDAYRAFRDLLAQFNPAQLTTAICSANLLKSVTLGVLIALQEIDGDSALNAAAATVRLTSEESLAELERQEQREEELGEVIARLTRYAAGAGSG